MTRTGDMLPIRTCAGCRARSPQDRLLRFARRADGHVVPANVTRDCSGRSAYLCPRRACLDQALKRRAFTRAFGSGAAGVSVIDVDADALWAATAEQLRREIELLDRSQSARRPADQAPRETSHSHSRRRGLEQLLSELSSQPKAPERSASKRGHTEPHANVTSANCPHAAPALNDAPRAGGAPNHG
jgi:hypothetical protein